MASCTSAGWVGLHALETRLLSLEGHKGTHALALACIHPGAPNALLHLSRLTSPMHVVLRGAVRAQVGRFITMRCSATLLHSMYILTSEMKACASFQHTQHAVATCNRQAHNA